MSEPHLLIDVSNSKYETDEDLIQIKFIEENDMEINYSKLIKQSQYIRDKYKYPDAITSIQAEIESIKTKFNIKESTIKRFMELIQGEKVNLPIKYYKDFYTLSEFFSNQKLKYELDNIYEQELCTNLDFTIQIIQDSTSAKSNLETKLLCKMEDFLSKEVNKCITDEKFKQLPIEIIYRIIDKSDKGSLDQDLLVDFIIESSETRYVMLNFVELDKMTEQKVKQFFKFIDELDEEAKKIYLQFLPFNLAFIMNIQNKYEDIFLQTNQIKIENETTKEELNNTKEKLDETKEELNNTKVKLNETKEKFNKTKEELNQTKEELDKTKEELNQTKEELDKTKEELNQTKEESDKTKEELNQTKEESHNTKVKLNNTKVKLNKSKEELDKTKEELDKTKEELDKTKEELNQTKEESHNTKVKLNNTKEELNETKEELNNTKEELNNTKEELNETKEELNNTKEELNETKEELNETKEELNNTKEELNQTKIKCDQLNEDIEKYKKQIKQNNDEIDRVKSENEQNTKEILVAGYDHDYRFGEKPNNKNKSGRQVISPPVNLSLNPSSILSFSAYGDHSIVVMRSGSLMGAGYNSGGRISPSLQKSVIDHFTDYCIKDESGRQLVAVSAVCTSYGALYMLRKSDSMIRHLVFCDCEVNGGTPIFLDIGNHEPVSLFGGDYHSAAIGVEGEVIFINRYSVKNSPSSPIEAVSLPGGEKASSVACLNDSVLVLSSNGRVFESGVKNDGKVSVLNFSAVSELTGKEIVCVSGKRDHCLAVSKEGRVFGRGSNEHGRLGLGRGTASSDTFTEISSLFGYEIRAAYAGNSHSLFETREGKILACGWNSFGQLLLSSGPGQDVYSPTETTVTSSASFCIAGGSISVVFIGNSLPPNTPNRRIYEYK